MPKAPKKNFKTDRVNMITEPALIKEFHDKTMTELHEGAWYDVLSKEYKPIYFTSEKNQKKLRNYIKRMKSFYTEKELNSFYNRFEQYEDMLSQNGREWGKETLKQWRRNKVQLGQSAGKIIGKRKQMHKIRNPSQILNVSIRKKKAVEDDVEMKDPVKMVSPTKGKDPVGAVEEAKKYGKVPSGMDRAKSRAEKAKEKAKNLRGKKIDEKRNPDEDMIANAPTETPSGQVSMKQAGKMTAETQRKGPHPAAQKLKKKKPSMTAPTTVPKKVPYAKVSPAATAMTELQRARDKQAQNEQKNKILTADTVRQEPHSKRKKAQESVDFRPKPDPKTSPFGQEPDTVYQQPKPGVNTAVQSEDFIPKPDPKTSPFGQEPDTVYEPPKKAAKLINDPSMIGKLTPSHLYMRTASTQTSIPGVERDNNIQLQVQEAGIQTDPQKMHSLASQSDPYTMPLYPNYPDRRHPLRGGESKGDDRDDPMDIDTVGIPPGGGDPDGTPGGVDAEPAEPPPPPPPGAPQPVQNAMGTQTGNTVDEDGNYIEIDKGIPSSGGVSRGIGSGASYNVKNERNRMQKSAKKLLHEIKAFIELYG